MNPPNTAVAQRPASKLTGYKSLVDSPEFQSQIARALPKHLTADRFLRIAITASLRTPKLLECTPASITNCLLTLSQLGLEPDGRRAHLIPFNNRRDGTVECTLIVDYKGLAELAMRSGLVANIHADVVRENDVFEYDRGQIIAHKIDFRKPRGPAFAFYAICRFKDGTEKAEVMSVEEVDAIRARSKSPNEGPWATDSTEMAKKTVFKRLSKWLPMSSEVRDAIEADDIGDSSEVNVTPETPRVGQRRTRPIAEQAQEHPQDAQNQPATDPEPAPAPVDPPITIEERRATFRAWLASVGSSEMQFLLAASNHDDWPIVAGSTVDEFDEVTLAWLGSKRRTIAAALKEGAK